ncbi:class I SAM-dependent methyltransferase [Pseudomarimonas arenosa]|uniref:Methyltransferase domain-containing protein n=1 Tax=Pseudomarimonas arenosa TaxID=2774145 RepID=A0AAW3ZIX4_9GAMM|nr:methyltransferase domain-containing protein [Pseudomarimonas arenosa]MBD8524890.1 methyltransferase domain-containing protein [Pseudomarimonas arenosa]
MSADRRLAVESRLDPTNALILEIGALDSPMFRKEDGFKVEFADYATRSQLAASSPQNPRYEFGRLVDVDYVISQANPSLCINKQFDLIIANHVIEHVPDTISWLFGLGRMLTSSGVVFLSIPDRRYTFDIVRRDTNFVDLLRAHLLKQKSPDIFNIIDHFWHHKSVGVADVESGRHFEAIAQRRFTPGQVLELADRLSKRDYADVHCHVFTCDSCRELLQLLREFRFLAFNDIEVHPTKSRTNEFHVFLSRFEEAIFKQGVPSSLI